RLRHLLLLRPGLECADTLDHPARERRPDRAGRPVSIAVLGVLVLNLLFVLAGSGILWGVRGWTDWREFGALGGVAYICGLAAVSALATLVPIWGGSLSGGVIVGIAAAVGCAGLAVGIAKRRPLPRRVDSWAVGELSAFVPIGLAGLCAALLGSLFRAARISPLTAWDAWGFWMAKAKAIYFFGGLDPMYFRQLWGQSYPLLVPTLAAMNFRFMGSANTTALGVQWWLLAVAFVWAGAGLLRRIAPATPTWIFLTLFVALPQLDARLLERKADWPLDIFFALSDCALLGWILTDEAW